MAAPGADGELLILTPPFGSFPGPPWAGAGIPAPVIIPIPNVLTLVGKSIYMQGVIFDAAATFGVSIGLTEGLAFTIKL